VLLSPNLNPFLEGYFFVAKRTQAAKRHRQSLMNRERNYAYRSRLRTFIKKANSAITENAEDKEALTSAAMRELDRMVSHGVLHKNNASRRKSRLAKAIRKSNPTPSTEAPPQA
jgi:small subunit ribosomal protein S20